MPEHPNLCIQIGLHKTGTTMLNNAFYPKHRDIHHLGKPYDIDDPVRLMLEEIMYASSLSYNVDRCRKLFREAVLPHLKGKKLVTINESRLSNGAGVERTIVAERLCDVVGKCKIIVILRRQDEFLKSLYLQWFGTKKTKLTFDEWLREGVIFARKAPFSLIDYHNIVSSFVSVFGRERVGIFLFEQFLSDRDAFARELSEFAGIDAETSRLLLMAKARNPRMSRLHVFVRKRPVLDRMAKIIRRKESGALVSVLRWAAERSGRAKVEFTPELESRLRNYIGASNARLAEEFTLPMERYGYMLDSKSAADTRG